MLVCCRVSSLDVGASCLHGQPWPTRHGSARHRLDREPSTGRFIESVNRLLGKIILTAGFIHLTEGLRRTAKGLISFNLTASF